jgi:hypothetical protein
MLSSPTYAAIQLQALVTGLTNPVFVTHAHDGSNRLFILEQPGVIKVLQPGSTTPTVFLDITDKVLPGGERGLLGLAFHPQYPSNPAFYVDYTRAGDGATVIARYQVSGDPNVASSAETVLLVIEQPFPNHNGGMLAFGPDGYLYIGMGDGGAGYDPDNRAQNLDDLLGKILRIDVDHGNGPALYSSPSTNPFYGPTPGADEVFAYGLRNPWRFSFDRATGYLYAGDVGQNQSEEIDLVGAGGNYGWRSWEGTTCTGLSPDVGCTGSGYAFPILEYTHESGRCSVTGGYVYRGFLASLPAGSYVFGDFCSGEIFLAAGGSVSTLVDTTLEISSFGEDEAGEIYVVDWNGGIYRIVGAGFCLCPDHDFNGDGRSDILWRHSSGTVYEWLLNGTTLIDHGSPGSATTDWTIVGAGDFNGDGSADILWRHSSGTVYEWLLNGTTLIDHGSPGSATTDWTIVGVGDFNGDGSADILWRHSSGTVYEWLLNGTTLIDHGSPGSATTDWTIVGIGDFNGDGSADILWRHSSGTVYEWLLNGTTLIDHGSLGDVTTDWTIAGVGDFNDDGNADILWRHSSGTVYEWLLNRTTLIDHGSPGSATTDWTIAGVGDFNGDGTSDILWRHNSGTVYEWLLSGTTIIDHGSLGDPTLDWRLQ